MSDETQLYVPDGEETDPKIAFVESETMLSGQTTLRIVERVTLGTMKMTSPPNCDSGQRGQNSESPLDTDDSDNLSVAEAFLNYAGFHCGDSTKLHVAVEHAASDGDCDVTPVVMDAGTEWFPSTAYVAGDFVRKTSDHPSKWDYCMECTTPGTSGASEPDWFGGSYYYAGDTFNDGGVVWTLRSVGRPIGVLETKGFPASAIKRLAASGYLSQVQTWDISGAAKIGLHVKNISGTSNKVIVTVWMD